MTALSTVVAPLGWAAWERDALDRCPNLAAMPEGSALLKRPHPALRVAWWDRTLLVAISDGNDRHVGARLVREHAWTLGYALRALGDVHRDGVLSDAHVGYELDVTDAGHPGTLRIVAAVRGGHGGAALTLSTGSERPNVAVRVADTDDLVSRVENEPWAPSWASAQTVSARHRG